MASGSGNRRGCVCVGRVAAARGLKGDFCVHSFTGLADSIAAYGPLLVGDSDRRLRVRVVGHRKEGPVLRADGIADRSAADALRGVHLYVERDALPPPEADEYYHVDLIGLEAWRVGDGAAAGSSLGRVTAVHDFGAGTVLEIERADAPALLVPFTREAVPTVDLAGRWLEVAALPGLTEASPADAGAEQQVREVAP